MKRKRTYKRFSSLRRLHATKKLQRPAAFEKWEPGDSLPVVGFLRDVVLALQHLWPDICHCFRCQFISPTLTRVTRVA